jgi:hypothetical protein
LELKLTKLKICLDFSGHYTDYPKTLLHTFNISYTNKYAELILGRQEINLDWSSDFHEAYMVNLKPIENTMITIGYSDKVATADNDAVLEAFADTNGDNGVYFFNAQYEGIENIVLNGYYYYADELAKWYGAKISYDTDMWGATAHYATSDVDVSGEEDGSFGNLEVRANISGLGLAAGYMFTDKDEGLGYMDTLGDNINPFEDGNQVFGTDARTYYISGNYSFDKFDFNAIYGQSKYEKDDKKESEINFSIDYSITDAFTVGALLVSVDADNSDDDYNRLSFTGSYAF